MMFERPVTFLVGENGSGRSTLVEAFAGCGNWTHAVSGAYVRRRPAADTAG